MKKINIYLILMILLISSVFAYSIDFIDEYGGEGSSIHDGITWVNDDLYATLDTIVSAGFCYDEDSDGTSTTETEFDYCYFWTEDDYYDCYFSTDSWIDTFCSFKPCLWASGGGASTPFGTPTWSDYLDTSSRTHKMIDIKLYTSCTRFGSVSTATVDAEDYYVIDAKRTDCDGENIDVMGRYTSLGYVEITETVCSPTGSNWIYSYFGDDDLEQRCDEAHDDTDKFSKTSLIDDPCRTKTGSSNLYSCTVFSECYNDAECSGEEILYTPVCDYDGSTTFDYDLVYYEDTCGGTGYESSSAYLTDQLCPNTKVCDTDDDQIESDDVFIACKQPPPYACTVSSDCWNGNPCNSDDRCGECYTGTGANFSAIDEDCTLTFPYCMDSSGSLWGVDDYSCQCLFAIDEENECCALSGTFLCGKQDDFCQYDSECESNLYCNITTQGDTPVGTCLPEQTNGEYCERDSFCISSYGCSGNICGECNSTLLESNSFCVVADKPYCSGSSPAGYGSCNLNTANVCDCCNRIAEEDECLEFPMPYFLDPAWIFSACVDGFDSECENYDFNSTLNITCNHIADVNYCIDCNSTDMCLDKYNITDRNKCNLDSKMCECSLIESNPAGCQANGFCFGKLQGGVACDCDSECSSGDCNIGICKSIVNADITDSLDDDFDDDKILNLTQTIGLNATNSSSDVSNITVACWSYSSLPYYDVCYSNVVNCTDYCPLANDYNLTWNTIHNFTSLTAGNKTIRLLVTDAFSTDTDISWACFRGDGYFCGESCFDSILNQDEIAVDYGGVCGLCNNSIKDGYETLADYGSVCGTCYDGIQNSNVDINGSFYDLSNPETDIDLHGRCGNCTNNIRDLLRGETYIDYGSNCGTCYDNIKNDYLNESEADYGGPLCGFCSDEGKSKDEGWIISRGIQKDIPFDFQLCDDYVEIIGFFQVFILIIIASGGVIAFLIIGYLLFFILKGVITLTMLIRRVTKVLIKISKLIGIKKKKK